MGWYKLVFKQEQPIHIGSAKLGVVNETEIFIPGSAMWGALTNTYLQKGKVDPNNKNKLEELGKYFETISNFFPSFDGKNILQPTYQKGEFGYLLPYSKEFLSEDKFRFIFVDTLVQTAIEPMSRKARDESLHELDYILPKPKQKLEYFEDNLYWTGIIQIDDELKDFLREGLKIFIGADVRYGYGETELVKVENPNSEDKNFWWINDDNIEIKTNRPSPYFIEAKENLKIEGEVLLIPEVDFRENIPVVTNASFYVSVGSKLKHHTQKRVRLYKGKLIDGDTML